MNLHRDYVDVNGIAIPPYAKLLKQRAETMPQRVFLQVDNESVTYGDMYAGSLKIALGMLALGIRSSDRIGIFMPNCVDFFRAFFAAQILGSVAVPLNARFKTHELAHAIKHSDIRMLFTTDLIDEHVNFLEIISATFPALEHAGEALDLTEAPELRRIVVFGGGTDATLSIEATKRAGAALDDADVPALPVARTVEDIAVMLYTSGTTANPKGCQLTPRGFYHSWISGYATATSLAEGEKVWSPLPFFHVGGIGPMTAVLSRGATMVSSVHYASGSALQQIRRERPEHLYPGFFTLLLPVLRERGYDKKDLSNARSALNVAPYETQLIIQKLLPDAVKVLQIFAMTEASGYVTLTRPDSSEDHRLRTNGTALPGVEVRIAHSESGALITDGEQGEIQFRGPVSFHSYYKDETATRDTILDGGWVRTGDCGRMDADGTLYFLGRIKDMLKVGGENVAAAEIEAYLSTHPAVKLSQVIGRADERLAEVPVAFVELLPGKAASEEDLIGFCKGKLASFKVPRQVIFISEWPMSATKIQKFKLRSLLGKAV